MPQTQPPVPLGPSTRTGGATDGTTTSRTAPCYYRGGGTGGAQHPSTRTNANPVRLLGGQHQAPIGVSTRDITDAEDNASRLADFEAAWEEIRFGVVSGREW